MNKPQLLLLLAEVRRRLGPAAPPPVVVGSQSFHALRGGFLPESVAQSVECDLFLPPGAPERRALEADLGADSDFHARHGYYAHPVGAGTVIPPPGWQARLQPLRDAQGVVWAQALEAHDLAACKLMAGREKDLEFLGETLRAGTVQAGALLERARLFVPTALGGVLADRLRRLEEYLRRGRLRNEAAQVAQALVSLVRPAASSAQVPGDSAPPVLSAEPDPSGYLRLPGEDGPPPPRPSGGEVKAPGAPPDEHRLARYAATPVVHQMAALAGNRRDGVGSGGWRLRPSPAPTGGREFGRRFERRDGAAR